MGQDMSCASSKSEAISPERKALEEVHDWMVKLPKSQDDDEIKIPRKDWNYLFGIVKGTLNGPPAIKRSRVDVHPNGVQILTNKSSNASTKFVDILQHTIAQKHNVKATIIETLDEVDKEKIFVVVCNKTQSGSPEKAVAKSMEDIKPELYGRIILIVLHVGRAEKLPPTPSRKQLSGTDFAKLGLIVDMGFENDEIYSCTTKESAFDEIKKFISSFEGTKIDSDTQTIVKDRTQVDGQCRSLQDSYNCKRVRGVDVHPNCVQILTNRSSNASTKFVDILQHTIVQKHSLKATIRETLEEVDKEKIFVVVCNKTQLGSPEKAVAKSLENITPELYGRVILIVLHVGRAEKLPLTPSSKQLNGTDFGKLGLIVDMGFENDEIYSCTTNGSAFDEIKKFISSFEGTKIDSDTQIIVKDRTHVDGQSRSLQDSDNFNRVRESMKTKTFIVDPSKSNASTCFITEFGREIMKKFGIVVDQKQIDDAKDLAPDSTLLVVCNATSRIESDIEKCLHPTLEKLYGRKILIVLHVARKGREPTQSSTKNLKVSSNAEKYESFDLIIDIAFTKEDGLYECTLNAKAFDELENVFSKISTTETNEDVSMEVTGDTENLLED